MSSPTTRQQPPDEQFDDDIDLTESTLEPAVAAPPKQRRRPALIGLGVALVALGGLGAAWLATTVSDTVAVIALRNDVSRGEVIEADDLTTANINADPNLEPIRASRRDELVGQYARNDLTRGSLLTQESVTESVLPAEGEAMVGVAVTPAQLPSEELRPGDTVRVVDTPTAQDEPPSQAPASIEATVVSSTVDENTGQHTVNVVLPENQAASLAARVATQRIVVVLMSRAGGD